MEAQLKTDERLDSIEVNMTSKGAFSFSVKRYYDFRYDEPAKVIQSIKRVYENLNANFPNKE